MAEEEKNEQQAEPEAEAPAEEPAAEAEAPAEPEAEAQAPAEAEAEAPAAAAAPADAPAEEAEEAEQLSPKPRRKRGRSQADGPGSGPKSLEDRLRERAERRARNAQDRRRWRTKRKNRSSLAGTPGGRRDEVSTPARESAPRKTRQGIVVSSKADKTITVRIDRVARHRTYGKVLRETGTLHAHDERNEANEGDVVRVAESRPLSRTKRWRLVEVLEKAR
jgi:small subunit ribosomal protein S17